MKVDDVADGQGNPPEVVTGTVWLLNAAEWLELLQVPLRVAAPEVAEQVWPRMLAVQWTPPDGALRLAEPLEDTDRFQVPLAEQLALKLKPEALTLHPVRLGALTGPLIGCPEGESSASPLVDDPVQVTVAVPSLMVTLVDEAVKGPVGETASADAMWAPSPITAASADAAR